MWGQVVERLSEGMRTSRFLVVMPALNGDGGYEIVAYGGKMSKVRANLLCQWHKMTQMSGKVVAPGQLQNGWSLYALAFGQQ